MVFPSDLERIAENARGVIVVIARRIAFTPRGERLPTERYDNLFAPFQRIRREPEFFHSAPVAIETKLPWAVEVQPILTFNRPALPVRTRILGTRIEELGRHEINADCGLRI